MMLQEKEQNSIVEELDRRIAYYRDLAEKRKLDDPEISDYYRGSAASLNLFASWLERANG